MAESKKDSAVSRRDFFEVAALGTLVACSRSSPSSEDVGSRIEPGPERAPEGPLLKAGLVGCGGRGTGAALNFLEAGPNLRIAALADLFEDQMQKSRKNLRKEAGIEVPDEHCFLGFDAYKQLIDSDVDIVLLATPPHFRPQHFEAAVSARKHVFMEKPLAVDPVGVRSILRTAEKAKALGLSVVTGTQRRHQRNCIETYNQIASGRIGPIVAGRCYSLRRQLWYRLREDSWSDMEYMIRDWVNWQWLSGDFIVEQHIHGLDVMNWFTNSRPVRAIGMGGRMRRVTGDQYDFFSVDYEMENGIHVHSVSRQINGCTNNISRWVIGTDGYSDCENTLFDLNGNVMWKYDEQKEKHDNSPYVQEHIDLVTSIRTQQPINEAATTAISTLTAVLGRASAYTGQAVSWEEMMQSDLRLGPSEYAMGSSSIKAEVPVPGA